MKLPGRIFKQSASALLYFFLAAGSVPLIAEAQTDSTGIVSDSVLLSPEEALKKELLSFEQKRKADSTRLSDLELHLQNLSKPSAHLKDSLEKEIQTLKDKDLQINQRRKGRIEALRAKTTGFPVAGFFDDTLFVVYNSIGGFTAGERASAIENRINKIAHQTGFNPDSLQISEVETTSDIVYRGKIIMSITENDAIWNNTTRQALAITYRNKIASAISKYLVESSFVSITKKTAFALLVLLTLAFVIYLIRRLFKRINYFIISQRGKTIQGLKIRNYTLLDTGKLVWFFLSISRIFRWVFILIVTYLALPLLFGIFPWTKNLAGTLIGYILDPLKNILSNIWHYLPNLFTIIVITVLFHYLFALIRYLKTEIESERLKLTGFYADWANPTYQIVRVLLVAFMIIVIFPYLPGSDSPVFQGVSVFLGFLFTFGSASSLSNIIAGFILTYMRLYKIGDRVLIGQVTGDVVERTLLVTRIRTPLNEIVTIPNSTVMNTHTVNYSSDAPERGLILHSAVTIGYNVPWKEMHRALIDAALKTERVMQEPKPYVLQSSLDDFFVTYTIHAYTKEPNKMAFIYSELHQNIQDICNERGIEIMSPHYRAMRDGNASTIPAQSSKQASQSSDPK
ncbi:MAG TPA: mechanosensitive ion channel domain-containing protein [Bacteroidia bacterium]|nr:mechanosensitive ion channel domain-containing protein [Bacteroidia bacterium]